MSKVNKLKSAKQLTFTYFSIVAFAIITIHFSLLEVTLEDFEHINAKNRLLHAKEVAQDIISDNEATDFAIPPFSHAYIGKDQLPNHLIVPDYLPDNKAVELKKSGSDDTEYFLMKTEMSIKNKQQTVYFLYFDDIYEISEEQVFWSQAKPLAISFLLILISLVVVLRISDRLTSPLSLLADKLENRSPNDLSPIHPPTGVVSKELSQLINSVNNYSARIHQLIERERSFNRYASHELRTPLMVMKGAIALLGQSNEPVFVEKQRKRLLHASNDMNDLVSTLLSLTREENTANLSSRALTRDEMQAIIAEHRHLLKGKPVECRIEMTATTQVKMPETALKILLGNLLKNAFACTEEGTVIVDVTPSAIRVNDSGIGLGAKPRGVEGYGLGLLIANDICRKYGWQLSHYNNDAGGCTAEITLLPAEIPSKQKA